MRCADCGKISGKQLNEFVDGRRVIYLCDLCKAEREWRETDTIPPPSSEKKTFWQRLKELLGLK